MPASVRVVSAKESASRDLAAIKNGTPSRVLMQRAGKAAAGEILRRFPERVRRGIVVYTGAGNNGGDGWVVAGELAKQGVPVSVKEITQPKTSDAAAEKAAALEIIRASVDTVPGVVVDALLGTGSEGEPRGEIGDAVREINDMRRGGAFVAALDVPSGLNATTGEHGSCVFADVTLTFGGVKRGSLVARDCGGEIVVVDIGLDSDKENPLSSDARLPLLVDSAWVHSRIPPIHFNAHKGTRKHLAIVGGGTGMPGAVVLAARAALRSGIGLVRALVSGDNLGAIVDSVPAALVSGWPVDPAAVGEQVTDWAHAIVIGPGLGKSDGAGAMLDELLGDSEVPLVLDADALNAFEGKVEALGHLLEGRRALLTPHAAEFARLAGVDVPTVLAQRFDIGTELAQRAHATVLLKGAPTIVFTAQGERYVIARGTAALGTGGSGDILSGIAGTLLAQTGDPVSAACCAAWIHGRAAELCEYVRGTTLDDVLYALPRAWNETEPGLESPLMATLPPAR
jgi:NAD(P)H-hydrate epimerase